jgi:hypothetical protein
MIIFYELRWRWLCWVGLHEWFVANEEVKKSLRGKPFQMHCDVCEKIKKRKAS